MNLLDLDLAMPIAGAIIAGAIIGAEREYRASPAGFRTHILVSLSSALLMLAAVHQVQWLSDTPSDVIRIDPVRMAHGVLTGIGFLCGGVIFREGLNVRGLTTAASLWTTATLGMLFGVGFYSLAAAGTVATLVVLSAVTVSEKFLPQRRYVRIKIRYRRDAMLSDDYFQAQLQEAGFQLATTNLRMDGETLEFGATLSTTRDHQIENFSSLVRQHPDVTGFDYLPDNE
ncbi:MAG: MgtC/SapB family protein [Tsuneonella sp.]|jgi:putative Mg2+ transporter-C (MgtC) family protein|uniref:MgtC/SapB family protein n=1 Tax=Sphingomonas sp. TaxID=28214 RepID=UPI002E0DF041|nr:MgtC/SapB family protein [Sphingomonas sp.]